MFVHKGQNSSGLTHGTSHFPVALLEIVVALRKER